MAELKDLWEAQANQQFNWYNLQAIGPEEKSRYLKDQLINLYEEVTELSKVANIDRYHILLREPVVKHNVLDQGVDIFKLLVAIMQLNGISCEEFVETFMSKTRIVDTKWKGQQLKLTRDLKLVVTDLDGCVCDISGFTDVLDEHRNSPDAQQGSQFGTQQALEFVKQKFYIGGGFRSVPPIEGSIEALAKIREMGYKLVIITARPFWQYARLYADTTAWLEQHGVKYDHIIFNKDKAEAVWSKLHPARPTWFIEDRLKHAIELTDIGIRVLLLNKARSYEHPMIKWVDNWGQILEACEGG